MPHIAGDLLWLTAMTIGGLFALLIAPFVGSFLGLIADRLPAGRPVLLGRSICDGCGRTLGIVELIPLVSYALQGGRSLCCGEPLAAAYPLVEIAAAAVALSAVLLLDGWLLWVSLGLGWSLLVLALIDVRQRILPDEITLPLIPIGLAVAALLSTERLPAHLIGVVLGFSSFAAIAWIYRRFRGREGLGLGDAKLFAAAGAWLGWEGLPGVLLIAAVTALMVALARGIAGDRLHATDEVAFGPYLALAFWGGWLFGPVILS